VRVAGAWNEAAGGHLPAGRPSKDRMYMTDKRFIPIDQERPGAKQAAPVSASGSGGRHSAKGKSGLGAEPSAGGRMPEADRSDAADAVPGSERTAPEAGDMSQTTAPGQATAGFAEDGPAEDAGGTGTGGDPRDELEFVAAARDAYLDSLLRLKAEFENYRRRTQRELADSETRARLGILAEFLTILDNLDRALSAAEHHEEGKVLAGVRLTHSLFADLLRKEGVEVVDPLGAPFDPRLHDAMVLQPSDEEEGTVTAVFDRGYVLGDHVLRPAKVAVSSGRPEESGG
jgi:molecular chaperone GrpE